MLRTFDFEEDIREEFIGADCIKYRGLLKLRYPVHHGIFQDKDDIELLFNYIYNKLNIKEEEIKEHPLLISEPLLNPSEQKESITSTLFDLFDVPAVFYAKQPILSLFSTSNTSGTILESGSDITQCCFINDGNAVPNSYIRYDYGGRNVSEYLQRILKYSGFSFTTSAEFRIVEKIKEMCYFCVQQREKGRDTHQEVSQSQFLLPDNTIINLKEEKVMAPEILFDLSIVGLHYMSFTEIVMTCMSKIDVDIRSKQNKLLFTGGNTLFKGTKEKFMVDYKSRVKNPIKFIFYISSKNKMYECWLGGNAISGLDSLKRMWITKGDWREKGKAILAQKGI